MNNAVIEIKASKTKLIKLITASILFVIAGFYFIFSPNAPQLEFLGMDISSKYLGYAAVIFFGLAAIVLFRKIIDKNAGIIIGADGITDNSSYTSVGFISWRDVEEVTSMTISRQPLILIKVFNPNDYLNNTPSGIKRNILLANNKTSGTPITISAAGLQCEHSELLALLQDGFMKYPNK